MTDKINIAFSFDYNFYRQAVVAISSLLDEGNKDNVAYNIYCLIKSDVTHDVQEEIVSAIQKKSPLSNVSFIDTSNYFQNAYEIRNISTATYSRLLLPWLVNLDRIIYTDVDVLFKDSLVSLWETDISNYYFGATKDIGINTSHRWNTIEQELPYWSTCMKNLKGKYYQAGVLYMNLQKWRQKKDLKNKIFCLSKQNFNYQDQDILNLLFKENQSSILTLSIKYNYMPLHRYEVPLKENIIDAKDYTDSAKKQCIIHYDGIKPWLNPYSNYANFWWDYMAKNTQYFDYFKKVSKEYLIKNRVKKHKIYKICGIKLSVNILANPILERLLGGGRPF